jgi:hypothetical protein
MPLMMDNDQFMDDMDDLFGDSDQVPITTPPQIKDLPQRLDELSGTNCCQ